MRAGVQIILPGALLATGLAGCAASEAGQTARFAPDYRGIETHLLDNDLVSFRVEMTGARDAADVERYAECAAAQYTLIRGFGFARHVRTKVAEEGGIWRADAVYTISPALPDGIRKIDAEVVAADCAENGIPMV
ncbi:hypothetical protein [Roseovarius salis]|uniref:hypothetical protein n=1 Tax=Roseovarius salis TaxID=3376063 RepID=UPI0037C978FB